MASAPAPPVASTKQTTNYAQLCRLLVNVGSQALRDTFDRIHPPAGLHLVLVRNPAHRTLQAFRTRRILNPTQWEKLYPTIPSSVSSASFDITLLMVLLRHICGLTPPVTGWDSLPSATDTSTEANIARVKYYQNTVYGHAIQASVDDATFNTHWQDISNMLVALGGASYGAAINSLKYECMDPDTEEHYRELLKEWKKDEDSIKEKLEEMEVAFKEGQLSDLELSELAGKIAAKWKTLGVHLEISDNVLEQIAANAEDKPYEMLLHWRNTSSSRTPYKDLYHALCHERVGLNNVAKEFCRNIKDKLGEVEENLKETLEQVVKQMKNVCDKLDSLRESSQDEDKTRNDLQKMKSEMVNISDKLDTLMAHRETEDEERDDFKKMKSEIRTISEKLNEGTDLRESTGDKVEELKVVVENMKVDLDALMNQRPPVKREPRMEGVFDPAKLIDGIRQLYKHREAWLAPFPWCEEFHFHLDDIFTRLRVVSRKKTRGTVTADIVNMSGIFKPHEECSEPRTVLIEGKPGMGKTTYCKKLVYDWATRKHQQQDCFPTFETVLLLKCRDMQCGLWEAIDDQLLPREVGGDVREGFFNFICQNQSDVLLVLDGLDEAPKSTLPVFTEIIQGRVLPKCHLVATARHEAGSKVRIHCDTLLEIEGFTEEDARKFIVEYFKTSENLAQKLLSKLKSDKKLKDMAANPLNTALLCLVCEEYQGIFPEIRTQLYVEIVQCTLRRYRTKEGFSETKEDLIEVYYSQLKHLGRIALNGLLEDNLDFEEGELQSHADDLPGFGFLSVQTGGSKLRPHQHYSFLHKSFQEWFAALYLYCQLIEKEIGPDSLVAEKRYAHELKEVVPYTCGMLAARCKEEAVALTKCIMTEVNQKVKDSNGWLTVVLECVRECKQDNSSFQADLARELGSFLKLKTLQLIDRKINAANVVVLADVLKSNTTLTKLDLSVNVMGDAGAAALAEALKSNRTLTRLNLCRNRIGDAGAAGLAKALKSNKTLTELNLSENVIGVPGATDLAQALKSNKALTKLNLSGNAMGCAGTRVLYEALESNTTLLKYWFRQ